MRAFTFSEVWGPFKCETTLCTANHVFTTLLTEEEYKSLPEKSGPEAAHYILRNNLGIALCHKCRKERGKE